MKKELVVKTAIWFFAILVLTVYILIIGHVFYNGINGLSFSFILQNPVDSGRSGGVYSILVSTILILVVTLIVAAPVGLATAILLAEFSRQSDVIDKAVRLSLDVLAAVPSIVFGLFGNVLFCKKLGLGFSILSGGLTLACMVLPLIIRSTEISLRMVSSEYRISGSALALSRLTILTHIILPAAAPGFIAGMILGIGRSLAETAALIFTSGYVDRMPESLSDSGRALSVHIFDLAMNVPGGEQNGYSSAIVLIGLVFVFNFFARYFTGYWLNNRASIC